MGVGECHPRELTDPPGHWLESQSLCFAQVLRVNKFSPHAEMLTALNFNKTHIWTPGNTAIYIPIDFLSLVYYSSSRLGLYIFLGHIPFINK